MSIQFPVCTRLLAVIVALTIFSTAASGQTINFEPHRNFDVGTSPVWIAVGDLNHDSHEDIVVANNLSNDVSVLLGNGNGDFGPATSIVVGTGYNAPTSATLGDFNEDGHNDLAISMQGLPHDLLILLGDGSGGFGAPADLAFTNTNPKSLTSAYINDDTHLDLVFANHGTGTVGVLLGNGDGTFGELTSVIVTEEDDPLPGFSGPTTVAIGDFDGDDNLDIAVALEFRSYISVVLGDGSGMFSEPIIISSLPLADISKSVNTDDFNGDGDLDLAVANSSSVYVLHGQGDGNFVFVQTISAGGSFGKSPAVSADFNSDGILDLALASSGAPWTVGSFKVVPGLPSGLFGPMKHFPLVPDAFNSWFIAVGDFKEDEYPDLIVANKSSDNVSLLISSYLPIADAGIDQSVVCTSTSGTAVTLDGSDSSDPDDADLTYAWTGPFPEGSGTVTGVDPTVTLPTGTSSISLVVNNGLEDSEPDTVSINITCDPPVADAGQDQNLTCTSLRGTPATLDGSASYDPDTGPSPLTYNWTGPFIEDNGTATGVYPTVTLPLDASTISLTVNDGAQDSIPDSVVVTIGCTPHHHIGLIIDEVNNLVADGVLSNGQGNALTRKLNDALKHLNKGKTHPMIQKLEEFINQVNAKMQAGTLSPEQGQFLIDAAHDVIARLSS